MGNRHGKKQSKYKREFVEVRKLREAEVVLRPPQHYDRPGCCNQVFMLVEWVEKDPETSDVHGPPRTGWCMYVDSGGPPPEGSWHYHPVQFCPFCGTKLTPDMPVQKTTVVR